MNFGKNVGKRIILYLLGLFVVALGIRLTLIAQLGTGSSTAFAWAMSKTVGLSVAFWVFVVNALCVVVQIIILKKDFKPIQLLQLAVSFIFSLFIAYVDPLVRWWQPHSYPERVIQLIVAIMVQALGIFFVVKAKLITMPIESMNLVIMQKTGWGKLGTYKILFDAFWFVLALLISLVVTLKAGNFTWDGFLGLAGIREGTVLQVLLIGAFINIYDRLFGKKFAKLTE
ncbi:MAG: YitT family protein [Firmicutes bacterium]|nr:YitT family protein [Bacillota bacterium]